MGSDTKSNIITYIPIVGAFLVFSGVLKLHFYYSAFNIKIVDYLVFSEIITSFLDDLWLILRIIIGLTIYSIFAAGLYVKFINWCNKKVEVNPDEPDDNIQDEIIKPWPIIFSFAVSALGIYWFYCSLNIWAIIVTSIFLFQFIGLFISWFSTWVFNHEIEYYDLLISLLVLFFFISFSIAKIEIHETKTSGVSVSLKTKTEPIKTSNEFKYIGKTEKFFFFHNMKSKENRIIPVSEVLDVKIGGCVVVEEEIKTPLAQEYSNDTIFEKYNWKGTTPYYYWHFSDEKNNLIENRLDTFVNGWYSYFLYNFEADNLSKKYIGNEKYRATWLRTFHNPIVFEIENKDEVVTLKYKISSGAGGYEFGEIIQDTSFCISDKEWQKLKGLIKECDFWNLSTNPEDIGGCDGSELILEGHHKNGYHMVHRWAGQHIGQCCKHLYNLSKLEIPEDEFY